MVGAMSIARLIDGDSERVAQRQFAALPYVRTATGLRVLLITSRETRRWVIPKGWPIRGLRPHEVAHREAEEEAGVRGSVAPDAIGTYSYRKRLHFFSGVTCTVDVYPMLVEKQKLDWKERGQRQLAWLEPHEAADCVDEVELAELLRHFNPR